MPIPDYQTLMLPVLRLAAEGESRVPMISTRIADEFELNDEERNEILPNSKQLRLHNRIHWAKFYMTKAGLIESPRRGTFVASKPGRELLSKRPSHINVETLRAYPGFVSFIEKSNGKGDGDSLGAVIPAAVGERSETPEEQILAAQNVLNDALRAELLARLLEQSPAFFERVIVDLLVAMGYGGSHDHAAQVLGKSGDGGIDGVIDEDRLGLDRIYLQAKRYAVHVSVGRPEVQGFVGSLVGKGANKGVFVTTSSFARPALEYAQNLQQRVILIDGSRLADLMIEFGVGVRVNRVVEVKRLDEDFFAEDIG